MGRYERKRREKRAKLWGAVALIITGVAIGVGVGVAIGIRQGTEQENHRANSVISEYMRGEYGGEMLEQCETDGLKECRVEFDYTDGVITGIEVVGHK